MDYLSIVISLFVLLFAITIHEASHAWAAYKMGDPTAQGMGRVSLNPMAHIDPIGTVLLPLVLVLIGAPAFGWAKPVMVNPYNLKNPRRDNLWISLAGPAANLTAAAAGLVSMLILKLLSPGLTGFLRSFLVYKQGFPRGFYPLQGLALILFYAVLINTYLAVFNLIPIPPLDGSGILAGLLPDEAARRYDRIRPFGFIIVLGLIYLGFLDIIIRPTGAAHLGNYVGALRNWVRLQDEYRCFYSIVDWHALSSEYTDSKVIKGYTFEVACDLLSLGLDPERCVLFVQSQIKEHAELHLLLSMITPLPWLERVPTFKEQQQELAEKDLNTYGFLGYPLLQTADIIIYKAEVVPVGEDQASHLELAREITRRFNRFYGPVFPEPQMLLTEIPKLAGTDGRKMSKSFGNAIYLKDSEDVIRKKISPMVTDTRRKRRSDPGEPDDCPVFTLHKAFVDKETRDGLAADCRSAKVGCLECKKVVIDSLIRLLTPYWEKRRSYETNPGRVWEILEEGNTKARRAARKTMEDVRSAIGL